MNLKEPNSSSINLPKPHILEQLYCLGNKYWDPRPNKFTQSFDLTLGPNIGIQPWDSTLVSKTGTQPWTHPNPPWLPLNS